MSGIFDFNEPRVKFTITIELNGNCCKPGEVSFHVGEIGKKIGARLFSFNRFENIYDSRERLIGKWKIE